MGQTRIWNGKKYTDDGGIYSSKSDAVKAAKKIRSKGKNARIETQTYDTLTRVSRNPDKFKVTDKRKSYVVYVNKKK